MELRGRRGRGHVIEVWQPSTRASGQPCAAPDRRYQRGHKATSIVVIAKTTGSFGKFASRPPTDRLFESAEVEILSRDSIQIKLYLFLLFVLFIR